MKITARGWPWQTSNHWSNSNNEKFGWNPLSVKGCGRFGGGWAIKIGITINKSFTDVIFDLGLGSIRIKRL